MRKLLPLLLLTSTLAFGAYQIIPESVSVGTSKPEVSASLHLTGSTKGFIPNRVTSTERNAISSPATGLLVYNTTLNELQVYNGVGWVSVGSGGTGGIDQWVTANVYAVDEVVIYNQEIYLCLIAHTAGVFATDLANGNWLIISDGVNSTGTPANAAIPTYVGTSGNVIEPSDVLIDSSNNITGAASLAIGGSLDSSSIFDVISTSKGSRPCSSMSEAQRDLISSPVNGLCIYNTTSSKLNIYNGSIWKAAGGGVDNWATSTAYSLDDIVIESNKIYQAEIAHTSGTFATDLAANKWVEIANDVASSTGILPIANGGTGSATKNFVDLTTNQTIAGQKTLSNKLFLSEIQASGSAGVDIHNSSGTQVANFGAGGGTGISLNGTSNIGSGSADYVQIAGGTGASTITGTGSSSNININLIPKGTGSVNINSGTATTFNLPNQTASTILSLDASKNVTSLSTATYPSLTELSYLKGATSSVQNQINAKFTLPSLTSGSVLFSNGTTISQDNAALFWDISNDRLGIGTTAPQVRLETNLTSGTSSALMGAGLINDIAILRAPFGPTPLTTSNGGAKWGIRMVGRNDGTYDNQKSGAVYAVSEETTGGYNRTVGLAFHTSPHDSTNVERMRITNTGNVGIGGTPNNNAILDVQSTTKAFMPPRQTTAQKNAVASPTAGMVVYDSDQKGLSTYNGTAWTTTGPLSVSSKTANYTALYSDDVILCDTTSGAFAITLPTAVGNTGKVFYIKKTDSSGNAVTINTTSSQTIDGSTTNVIQTQYKTIQVVSNGSGWSIL